jgi:hypothetical protein
MRFSAKAVRTLTIGFVLAFGLSGTRAVTSVGAAAPKVQHCAVNEWQLGGQANSVITGASAGQTTTPPTPDQVLNPDDAGQTAAWIVNAAHLIPGTPQQPVTIVIVDDFSTPTPDTSHGQFVYTVTQMLVTYLEQQNNLSNTLFTIQKLDVGSNYTSNYPTYTTDFIADQATGTVALTSGASASVINLSFALIPCQANNGKYDFQKFLKDYAKSSTKDKVVSPNSSLADTFKLKKQDLAQYLASPDLAQLDPLLQYLMHRQDPTQPGHIPTMVVAAAGNFGPDFPSFFPGAWPNVISVSASGPANSLDSGQLAQFSNNGKVMVAGQWYKVPNPLSTSDADAHLYIEGTSFAAPGMSVLMAYYLSISPTGCAFSPLTHGQMNNPWFNTVAPQMLASPPASC